MADNGFFIWDPAKAATNARKRGVTFEEATTAVLDPLGLADPDKTNPENVVVIGTSEKGRILFVVTLTVHEDVIRIISARRASPTQRKRYAEEDR